MPITPRKTSPTISIARMMWEPVGGGVEDHGEIVPRAALGRVRRDASARGARAPARSPRPAGSPPSDARRLDPGLALAVLARRAQRGAARDQLGHRRDRLDAARVGDPHEAVGVEVVAEQHALALLARREEPRPAVVDEVGLVDRLEPEREALGRERREDRLPVGLARGAPPPRAGSRRAPRAAIVRGVSSRRAASLARQRRLARSANAATAATVASISASPWASEGNRHSYWLGAT